MLVPKFKSSCIAFVVCVREEEDSDEEDEEENQENGEADKKTEGATQDYPMARYVDKNFFIGFST